MCSFILRPWQLTDAEPIAAAANNPSIAANLRNVFPSPYTLPKCRWPMRLRASSLEDSGSQC